MAHATRPLVTAHEFASLPDHDHWCELVAGRVVRMSPPGLRHGEVTVALASLLRHHVKAHRLGFVGVESGFTLASNPDTVRGPDISFIRRERIPPTGLPRGFWVGPPDLAVEVLSPDDRAGETRAKIDDYLTAGVPLVVVVDPDARNVTVFRASAPPVPLGPDDELDLDEVVPGFRCAIHHIFA